MARISTYVRDQDIHANDIVVGSEFGGYNVNGIPIYKTKNYRMGEIQEFIHGGTFTALVPIAITIGEFGDLIWSHSLKTVVDTNTTLDLDFGDSFSAINEMTFDAWGHVASYNTTTYTFPDEQPQYYFNITGDATNWSGVASVSQRIDITNTVNINGGDNWISTQSLSTDTVKIFHNDVDRIDPDVAVAAAQLEYTGTFNVITSVTSDVKGHVTAVAETQYTLPDIYSFTVKGDNEGTKTISSGNTLSILATGPISTLSSDTDTITITHDSVTREDTADAQTATAGGTIDIVDSVTSSDEGHITAINVKTVTLPANITYGVSAVDNGKIRLTGSDTTTDDVTIAGGTNVTISTDASTDTITIASEDTTYSVATDTVLGLIELFSDTDQSVAANTVTTIAGRTYGLQLNSDDQGVINVPWTNTTYGVSAVSNGKIRLTGSNLTTDDVTIAGGTGISIETSDDTITISATALALTSVQTAANEAAHLALTTQEGDVVVRTDLSKTYIRSNSNSGTSTMADFILIETPFDTVLSLTTTDGTFIDLTPNAATTGAVTVTADLSATGTASATTFLRGDNVWTTPVTSNIASTGISVSSATGAVTITNTDRGSSQNIFKNIAVAGQNTVTSEINNDTLTLVGGTNVTITTDDSTDTITIASQDTIPNDGVTEVTAGGGITLEGDTTWSADQAAGSTFSVSHADTSTQASVDNSDRTYIQDITLDDYGHITGIASATETVVNTDTWNANALNVAGYVAAPSATVANKVWKTDASGNPAWRDDADNNTWIANALNVAGYVAVPVANKVWKTDGAGTPAWRDDADTDTVYTHPTFGLPSVSNSARTYIQSITLDNGHITGISSATETVVNTNTDTITKIGTTTGNLAAGNYQFSATSPLTVTKTDFVNSITPLANYSNINFAFSSSITPALIKDQASDRSAKMFVGGYCFANGSYGTGTSIFFHKVGKMVFVQFYLQVNDSYLNYGVTTGDSNKSISINGPAHPTSFVQGFNFQNWADLDSSNIWAPRPKSQLGTSTTDALTPNERDIVGMGVVTYWTGFSTGIPGHLSCYMNSNDGMIYFTHPSTSGRENKHLSSITAQASNNYGFTIIGSVSYEAYSYV